MPQTKRCSLCGEEKPLGEFYRNKKHKDGLQYRCKTCDKSLSVEWNKENREKVAHQKRKWRKENPGKQAALSRKHNYGISHEDYIGKLEAQGYKCECCGEPLDMENTRRVHVDHNHETGQVRGILCQHCNHMMGNAKDDTDRLIRGATYLTAYQRAANVN